MTLDMDWASHLNMRIEIPKFLPIGKLCGEYDTDAIIIIIILSSLE